MKPTQVLAQWRSHVVSQSESSKASSAIGSTETPSMFTADPFLFRSWPPVSPHFRALCTDTPANLGATLAAGADAQWSARPHLRPWRWSIMSAALPGRVGCCGAIQIMSSDYSILVHLIRYNSYQWVG